MREEFHPVVKVPLRKGGRDLKTEGQTCIESESRQRASGHGKGRTIMIAPKNISVGRKMNETHDYIVKDYTGKTQKDNTV